MSPECEILPNFHWKVSSHKYCICGERGRSAQRGIYFQSLVPRKEAPSILLLLEDSTKLSDPGSRRWSRPSTQADAASSCTSGNSDTPLNWSHSTVYKAHLHLGLYLFLASILCKCKIFTGALISRQNSENSDFSLRSLLNHTTMLSKIFIKQLTKVTENRKHQRLDFYTFNQRLCIKRMKWNFCHFLF